MSATMPDHMPAELSDLAQGDVLLWANAPKPPESDAPWARRLGSLIHIGFLIFMGYMTYDLFTGDTPVSPYAMLFGLLIFASFLAGQYLRLRIKARWDRRAYDHIIITNQALYLGRVNLTQTQKRLDTCHISKKKIDSVSEDFFEGSPCIAVQVTGRDKPLSLIGSFDGGAAIAALRS